MIEYKLLAGSPHHQFLNLRTPVQIHAGGYGSGKTTNVIIKCIKLAIDYPGSVGLIARVSAKKAWATVYKDFIKWCPKEFVVGQSSVTGEVRLSNGSVVIFGGLRQEKDGKTGESTSNILSANYDWAFIEQIDDKGFQADDIKSLLTRLRGTGAKYVGDDPTMPESSPCWLMITTNPKISWFYRQYVEPLLKYQTTGMIDSQLLCLRDDNHIPLLDDKDKIQLLIEMVTSTTEDNKANLEPNYIAKLRAVFSAAEQDRYLRGLWVALDGAVFDKFQIQHHVKSYHNILDYYNQLCKSEYEPHIIEAYDYGLASPACYLFAFCDSSGNLFILDGFYETRLMISQQAEKIKQIRKKYIKSEDQLKKLKIFADPQIFKHVDGNIDHIIANQFYNLGIDMLPANNSIDGGIQRVNAAMFVSNAKINPFDGTYPSSSFFVSADLDFWQKEVVDYIYTKDEKPIDKNNHAMDATRYLFTESKMVAKRKPKISVNPNIGYGWTESTIKKVRERPHYG